MKSVTRRGLVAFALAACVACDGGGASKRPLPALPDSLNELTTEVAQAIERAHAELEEAPGEATSWSRLAMVYHANRLLSAADDVYAVAIEMEPAVARHRYRRALCQWELGRTEAAVTELREALRLAPGRMPPNWRLGEWLLERGELASAMELFAKATNIQPGFPPAWIGQARIHLLLDETDEALVILDRLASVMPNERYIADLRDVARRQAGLEPESAVRSSQSFEPVWNDPWEDEILKYRAESALTRAILALGEGRPNRALSLLESELERRPEDTTVLRNLAAAYAALGREAEALAAFERCLELQPENSTFLLEAAEAYEMAGQLERSLELIQRAAEEADDRRWLHQRRGRILHALGRHEEALFDLRKVLENQPDNTKYSVWLGGSLSTLGNFDEAATVFEAGLEHRPKYADLLLGLADARMRASDFDAADEALDRIRGESPEVTEAVRRMRTKLERRRARSAKEKNE